MKKLIIAALAAVTIMSLVGFIGQGPDGQAAMKTLNDLQEQLYKDAGRLTQQSFNKIQEQIKAKAIELTNGVEVGKIPGTDAYNWANVFFKAGKFHETCELAKAFIGTGPDAYRKFDMQSLMLQACNSLGEADSLQATLKDIRVPHPSRSSSLASSTVYEYVDTIQSKLGVDAAIATLDEVEKNLVFEAPADYAKRMLDAEKKRAEAAKTANTGGAATITDPNKKAKTDEERLKELETASNDMRANTKFLFVDKKAELFEHAGQKDKAVALLKEFVAATPAESRVLRTAKGSLTRMEMIGAPRPAITKERSYGEFESLEALKGKVVLLDFFAHWCGPCIASFPEMKKLYADFKDKGLEIVGFTTYYGYYKGEGMPARDLPKDTEFAKMGEFLKEHELPWPVVYGERSNFDAYGVTGIPHVAVIDRSGNVRKIKIGYSPASFKEFRDFVEKLLAEK